MTNEEMISELIEWRERWGDLMTNPMPIDDYRKALQSCDYFQLRVLLEAVQLIDGIAGDGHWDSI